MNESELINKAFYQSCHKVFRAFLLWLEEPRLQENNFLLKDLPPQYETTLLTYIMQGSTVSLGHFVIIIISRSFLLPQK